MNEASRNGEHLIEQVSHPKTMAGSDNGLLAQPIVVLFLLSFLVIVTYSNTFSSSFHFDDWSNILENSQIKNLSNFLNISESRYVGLLSFALNYHFGRLNVFGYHLVNLLIHITNGFLVYTLVFLLLKTPRMLSSPSTYPQHPAFSIQHYTAWIAITTAFLFVTHPIQTQAVTYIVQRFTSLAALFYLLSVVCYLKWRLTEPEGRSRHLWYAGAWVATVLAMKTKETSFTLPLMILLVEGVFFRPSTWKRWVGLIPFLLTLPIIPLSFAGEIGEAEDGFVRKTIGEAGGGFARETTEISRPDYLFTQFRVIVTYLRLLILPIHQNLDYDYPIYHSLLDPPVFFSFLFVSFLLGLALYLLFNSQFRLVAFGLLWFFLTLSIESSIIPIRDVIFEHRLYLPSMGFMLAMSVAVLGFLDRSRIMAVVTVGGIVTILSIATYERNLIWKDEITLWTNVVRESPNKPRGYINLGAAYEVHDRLEEAIQAYKTALTLKPDYEKALNNLGNAYKDLGRREEASQAYKAALMLNPGYIQAHYNLGVVYYKQRKLLEAIVEFKEALRLSPDYAQAHFNLGNVYKDLGRLEEALQEYQMGSKIIP